MLPPPIPDFQITTQDDGWNMLLGEFGRSEAKPTHKCHCKFPMDIQGFPAFGQRKNSTTSHVFFGPKSAQENDQCFFFTDV